LTPSRQGLAELYQLRQASLAQLVHGAKKARHESLALLPGAVFLQQSNDGDLAGVQEWRCKQCGFYEIHIGWGPSSRGA
jgi:hypothetical protein